MAQVVVIMKTIDLRTAELQPVTGQDVKTMHTIRMNEMIAPPQQIISLTDGLGYSIIGTNLFFHRNQSREKAALPAGSVVVHRISCIVF